MICVEILISFCFFNFAGCPFEVSKNFVIIELEQTKVLVYSGQKVKP